MAWVWPLHYRHVWRRNVCLGSNTVLRPPGVRVRLVNRAGSWLCPNQNKPRIDHNRRIVISDNFISPKCLRERLWTGLILSPSGRWRRRLRNRRVRRGTVTRRTWSCRRCHYSKVSYAYLSLSAALLWLCILWLYQFITNWIPPFILLEKVSRYYPWHTQCLT